MSHNNSLVKSMSIRIPLSLSTISDVPPTLVAITGIPYDIASMIDTGSPSVVLKFIKISI